MSPLPNTGDATAQANRDNEGIADATDGAPTEACVSTSEEECAGALKQAGAPDLATDIAPPPDGRASFGSELLAAVNELLPLLSR